MKSSSQRNTYLTGFTLFLSLVLTRTFYITLDLIHTQEEYAKLKKTVRSSSWPLRYYKDLNKNHIIRRKAPALKMSLR